MQNLRLIKNRRRWLDQAEYAKPDGDDAPTFADELDAIASLCPVSADHEGLVAVLTKKGVLSLIDGDDAVNWWQSVDDLARDQTTDSEDTVTDARGFRRKWFSVTQVDQNLVCISHGGAIASASLDGLCEIVGEFENGISAACWSCSCDVLLLATFLESDDPASPSMVPALLCMNSQWDVLAETTFDPILAGSVVHLCWRPDGKLCAVSSVDAADEIRKVRVFDSDGLQFSAIGRNEEGSGKLVSNLLDTAIAWAGSETSNLLAAVQRKGKKQQIAFFEPNGLRHREFTLCESTETAVHELCWNVDSSLLAVSLSDAEVHRVQLWHRSNYHWYLKRELLFRHDQTINKIKFSSSDINVLNICFGGKGRVWHEYTFVWDPSWNHVAPGGTSRAYVVDGNTLHITNLNKAIIPPPMSSEVISFHACIGEVFWHESDFQFWVVLSDGSLFCCNADRLLSKVETKDLRLFENFHFAVLNEDERTCTIAAACRLDRRASMMWCHIAVLKSSCHTMMTASVGKATETGKKAEILSIVRYNDQPSGGIIQYDDGSFEELAIDHGAVIATKLRAEPFLEPCPWMSVWSGPDLHGSERYAFGLSFKGRLYWNDVLLSESTSSFQVSLWHGHLVFITAGSPCQLRCIPLMNLAAYDPLMGTDNELLRYGYAPRKVERGARLVSVLPNNPSAVMQMPRGNLECVYPRALVIRFVMRKLFNTEYDGAYAMMRRHKVDLNLIVDLDPNHFVSKGISLFLQQVPSADHINLFVTMLQNTDCTESLYPIPTSFEAEHRNKMMHRSFDFSTKVNVVCRKLREFMLSREPAGNFCNSAFFLPLLTTYAKECPPDLEAALLVIRGTSIDTDLLGETVQRYIQYLAFLSDYETLYATALGMYNFDMARAIARGSQMDPKIYLSELKTYRTLPTHYGRYRVDTKLGRHESALRNLISSLQREETIADDECGERGIFSICMELIDKFMLHRVGLELFNEPEERRLILISLAEHFMKEGLFHQALQVYLVCVPQEITGAVKAARAGRDWKALFWLVERQNGMENSISSESPLGFNRSIFVREVADEVVGDETHTSSSRRTRLAEAAIIVLDYGNDPAHAVDLLVKAENWKEAFRIASLHKRLDLAARCVEAAKSSCQTFIDDVKERASILVTTLKQFDESLTLFRSKAEKNADRPMEDGNDDGSLFSLASNASNLSLMSGSSVGSSTSISSVLSLRSKSTFTVSGAGSNRHKSKFNQIGATNKKKRNGKKGRAKAFPGSETELISLAETMRLACPDGDLRDAIAGTISFLISSGHSDNAEALFQAYNESAHAVQRACTTRRELHGGLQCAADPVIRLPVEDDVGRLQWQALPESMHQLFAYFGYVAPEE